MKTVGMMRVKNEARWIEEVVLSLQAVCERVYVWDNHSDDGTPDICRRLGCVVIDSYLDKDVIDESHEKNLLLASVMKMERDKPDWIVHIDGDEVLETAAAEKIKAAQASEYESVSFRVIYLWDDPHLYRTDGHWGRFWRPSMFRTREQMQFGATPAGGHFHCGNVPYSSVSLRSDIALKHYGYLHAEDRQRKYEFYNRKDPNNDFECCYVHILGIPDRHAPGPMTFGKWEG